MSTIEAAVAAIVLTENELDPHITHPSTRRWLSGPGLPGDSDLFTFTELRRDGLRTVEDPTGDQLVIGALTDLDGLETESVLLDGTTGEISTTSFVYECSELIDRTPLAPSLPTLVRFATATDELRDLRGQFASYAGRFGPTAVEEASRQLQTVFEEGTGGEVPAFWKIAALIRPLALVAGPGTDSELALDLPSRLLDQEFGRGKVMRYEDIDFPLTLTHEPTRRFLRETGLPEDGILFHLDPDAPLATLAELYPEALVPRSAHLIRLGDLQENNSLVVDGETGAILNWSEPDATLYPLNTDISTLAFTLWLLHRERTIDNALNHELTGDLYAQVAKTMLQVLSTIDPTGTTTDADWHYWTELFQDEAGGVL